VITAEAEKNTGYQGSILDPKSLFAMFLAGRLARRLCKAANPIR
jgi:hypothetical protein